MMDFQMLITSAQASSWRSFDQRPGPPLVVTKEGKVDIDHLRTISKLPTTSSFPGEMLISSLPAKPLMSEMRNSVERKLHVWAD
jgi:hypothetical protein